MEESFLDYIHYLHGKEVKKMAEKVSCLNCIALLVNLPTAWIDGDRASLGKCIKKEFQIRQTDRYCKTHMPIDPNHFPNYLEYQRRKIKHTDKTLDLIQEYNESLNNQEKR